MAFKAGIIGLPNVGKSSLFNALSASQALAANYPFATVDPNVARVPVPDTRLNQIAQIAGSAELVPTTLDLVDIAGLVRGASKGEGLGNQFLGHIRQVDAVLHVLRIFSDPDVIHVEGGIDPLRDLELIETELQLADLEVVERRLEKAQRQSKSGDAKIKKEATILETLVLPLRAGESLRTIALSAESQLLARELGLLTQKPMVLIINVSEEDAAQADAAIPAAIKQKAAQLKIDHVAISAKVEAEIASLPVEERSDFLAALGLQERGLDRLIRKGYDLLKLQTYFTAGPKEARAWTIPVQTKAPQAAGVIHSDFERGFICAETVSYQDFVQYKGWSGAKEAGKVRQEGKEYVVHEGDVIVFRFNV